MEHCLQHYAWIKWLFILRLSSGHWPDLKAVYSAYQTSQWAAYLGRTELGHIFMVNLLLITSIIKSKSRKIKGTFFRKLVDVCLPTINSLDFSSMMDKYRVGLTNSPRGQVASAQDHNLRHQPGTNCPLSVYLASLETSPSSPEWHTDFLVVNVMEDSPPCDANSGQIGRDLRFGYMNISVIEESSKKKQWSK